MDEKPFYVRHDDDAWVDEVRIQTIPRYKTSGLSGDEWRVSVRVQLLRKGCVVAERGYGTIDAAVAFLPGFLIERRELGCMDPPETESLCFQPGCSEPAVSEYRLRKEYCQRGHASEPAFADMRRKFCQKHLQRGDCGLEDADANYEVVSGPGPDEASGCGEGA